jgi:hypothetical protein
MPDLPKKPERPPPPPPAREPPAKTGVRDREREYSPPARGDQPEPGREEGLDGDVFGR